MSLTCVLCSNHVPVCLKSFRTDAPTLSKFEAKHIIAFVSIKRLILSYGLISRHRYPTVTYSACLHLLQT